MAIPFHVMIGGGADPARTANLLNPTDGTITLDLSATQTSALKAGRYVYDVELVSNTATVERIVEGIVTIYPEATK